jgi:hypothetical protein
MIKPEDLAQLRTMGEFYPTSERPPLRGLEEIDEGVAESLQTDDDRKEQEISGEVAKLVQKQLPVNDIAESGK